MRSALALILACFMLAGMNNTCRADYDDALEQAQQYIAGWQPAEELVLGSRAVEEADLPPAMLAASGAPRLCLNMLIAAQMQWDGEVDLPSVELDMRRAVVLARLLETSDELDWSLMRLGMVRGLYDYPGSQPYVDLALSSSLNGRVSYGRCQLLGFAAQNALGNGDFDVAQDYALRAINDCNQLLAGNRAYDLVPLSLSYGTMVSLLMETGRYSEAELLLNHFLTYVDDQADWAGGCHWWAPEAAQQFGMEGISLALLEQLNREDGEAWWMFSPQPGPSSTLRKLRDGSLAEAVYAAGIHAKPDSTTAAESYIRCAGLLSLGIVNEAQGLPAEAMDNYRRARDMADRRGYRYLARMSRRQLAEAALATGALDEAKLTLAELQASVEASVAARPYGVELEQLIARIDSAVQAGDSLDTAGLPGAIPPPDPLAMQRRLDAERTQAAAEDPLVAQLAASLLGAEPDWQASPPAGMSTPQAALDALLALDDAQPSPEALCLIVGPLGMQVGELSQQDFEQRLLRAEARLPGFFPLLVAHADYLADLLRESDAMRLLDQAEAISPGDPVALLLRARLYGNAGQAWSSYTCLQRALANGLEQDSRLAYEAHMACGRQAYESFSLPEAARDHFWLASTLRRDQADPFIGLALLHEMAGDSEQAIAKYRRAIELEPGNLYSWQRLSALYYYQPDRLQEYQEARKQVERLQSTQGSV